MIPHSALAEIAGSVYRGAWSATVAGDVHYALLPREGELVVAVPGTHPTDALDWLRDASVWPTWIKGLGYIHSGFGLGARAAWASMSREVGKHDLVTFTGHSLGGALAACLGAMHAMARPGQSFRVVTFGQPRLALCSPWFGHALSKGVEQSLYARRGDIVPNMPFWPYLHGAAVTRIGTSTFDWIEDHAVVRYVADLKAAQL